MRTINKFWKWNIQVIFMVWEGGGWKPLTHPSPPVSMPLVYAIHRSNKDKTKNSAVLFFDFNKINVVHLNVTININHAIGLTWLHRENTAERRRCPSVGPQRARHERCATRIGRVARLTNRTEIQRQWWVNNDGHDDDGIHIGIENLPLSCFYLLIVINVITIVTCVFPPPPFFFIYYIRITFFINTIFF